MARVELDTSDTKLNVHAGEMTDAKASKAKSEFQSAFINDIRTRFESQDPSLLVLLDQVRAITAMVEEVDHTAVHGRSESCARESRRDATVADTDTWHW